MSSEADWTFGEKFENRVTNHAITVFRRDTDEMKWLMEWSEVEEVIAWKEDLFSVDCICMGFAWRGSDLLKAVDEGMAGWKELQAAIEIRLGVKETDWWRSVAMPPFARNQRTIWKRPDLTDQG